MTGTALVERRSQDLALVHDDTEHPLRPALPSTVDDPDRAGRDSPISDNVVVATIVENSGAAPSPHPVAQLSRPPRWRPRSAFLTRRAPSGSRR